ncbi:MAG: HEAT repeat domain-containing protein [Myxococcaceae bacterium]|jgi:HEAT repeat protein|nr:HEAT repeat domain-containing protein [Myxococcaceae bacterium]MCA3010969.1 HEAT repeat domain-containing protein [Myxococcaceae bacterium]
MRCLKPVGLALVLSLSGCKPDLTSPEYWEKRIEGAKSKKEKKAAIEALRAKHMSPAMLPMLNARLSAEKSADVKADLARVLGEAKSEASIEALTEAIVLTPADTDEKALDKEIANALGNIGSPKAAQTLVKLLGVKDNYTVLAAIDGLGDLKAKEGFEALNAIASDDTIETFITKKAIIALGNIGDPRAVPTLVKAMFKERKSVSFYLESSFALYQLGTPAADALLPVLDRSDAELYAWAEKNNVKDFALQAKSAQVLGDLMDMRAEKTLIAMLNPKTEFDDVRAILSGRAADALGRMRSKNAVKPMVALVTDPKTDASVVRECIYALVRVGNAEGVPALITFLGKSSNWDARDEIMRGITMLGTEKDVAAFDKATADEGKKTAEGCKGDDEGHPDCKNGPEAAATRHLARVKEHRARLEAAMECKGEAACWGKKLDDKSDAVRERAAAEVGRSNDAALAAELFRRLKEQNVDARLSIIQATNWLINDNADAMKAAKAIAADLEKQLRDEKGKTDFAKTNEDLRRLYVRILRG